MKFEITSERLEETLKYFVEDANKEFVTGKRNRITVYRECNSKITNIELLFYGNDDVRSICSKYQQFLNKHFHDSLSQDADEFIRLLNASKIDEFQDSLPSLLEGAL